MKINPQQAVKAVIAHQKEVNRQNTAMQKHLYALVKNRKAAEAKKEKEILAFLGVKGRPESRAVAQERTEQALQKTLKSLQTLKLPIQKKTESRLVPLAKKFGKGVAAHPNNHPGKNTPGGEVFGSYDPPTDLTFAGCFSAATNCVGNQCQLSPAMMFPFFRSTGEGGQFGYLAVAVPGQNTNSLFFSYSPEANGTANFQVETFLTGDVVANTQTRDELDSVLAYFSRVQADTTAGLRMLVWQGTTLLDSSLTLLGILHSDDGSFKINPFRNTQFNMSVTTVVTQDVPIVIEIRLEATITGMSDYAVALVNFSDGPGYGITVAQLCYFLDSPIFNTL
jgi:hypothetical protein